MRGADNDSREKVQKARKKTANGHKWGPRMNTNGKPTADGLAVAQGYYCEQAADLRGWIPALKARSLAEPRLG
jgi:hypothetical protein